MNHLADRSEDEMKKMRGYRNTGFNSKFLYKPSLGALPSDVNWWIKGKVIDCTCMSISRNHMYLKW